MKPQNTSGEEENENDTDTEDTLDQSAENEIDDDLETIDNIRKYLNNSRKTPQLNKENTHMKSPVVSNPKMIEEGQEQSLENESNEQSFENESNVEDAQIKKEPETIMIIYDNVDETKEFEFRIIIEPKLQESKDNSEDTLDINDAQLVDLTHSIDIKDNFTCVRCYMSFENLKALGIHYRSKHYKKRKTLWKSKFGIAQPSIKRRKIKKMVITKMTHRCNKCMLFFSSYKKLLQHKESFEHNRVVMCDVCNKTFKYKYLLRLHKKVHKKDDQRLLTNYRCIPCQMDFNTFPKVIVHYGEVHDGQMRCILCNEMIRQGLKRHMKTHRLRVYKCLPCDRLFDTNDDLKAHYHTPEHIEVKTCKICNKVFENPARKRIHMESVHEEKKDKEALCEYCGVSFTKMTCMNRHRIRFHNVGESIIMCDLCGMIMGSRTSLRNHMAYVHAEGDDGKKLKQWKSSYSKTAKCLRGGKPQKSQKSRVRNQPKAKVENICYICLMDFSDVFSHAGTHSEHEALEAITKTCPKCNLNIRSERVYFYHMLKEHELFSCFKCQRVFLKKCALHSHMKAHGTDNPETMKMNEENVECLVCHMKFKYKSSIRTHMYIHTGEKPYQCDICGKSFRRPTHVKLHKKTRHEERKNKNICEFCNDTYTNRHELMVHLNEKHRSSVHCSECDKIFVSRKGLEGHIDRMHLKSNAISKSSKQLIKTDDGVKKYPILRNYKCGFCIRVFKSENACANHMKRFHPQKASDFEELDIKDILDPRRKDCSYCHRYFKSDQAFNNHLKKAHPQHFGNDDAESEYVLKNGNTNSTVFIEDYEVSEDGDADVEEYHYIGGVDGNPKHVVEAEEFTQELTEDCETVVGVEDGKTVDCDEEIQGEKVVIEGYCEVPIE